MGHRLDRGDVIDMLEESQMRGIPIEIHLRDGRKFEDRVKEIGKLDGEDIVVFADHEPAQLRRISDVRRAWPVEHTYAGKH
jgi:hypothetical protein